MTPKPTTTATPSPAATPVGTATLRDDGCQYSGPATFSAGSRFTIEVVNETADASGFDLWRLHAETTYESWVAYHEEAFAAITAGGEGPGEPRAIADPVDLQEAVGAGGSGTLVADGTPGVYALQCWRFRDDVAVLLTTAGPFVATPYATVTLRDDGCEYLGPSVVSAGKVVLELLNSSIDQFDAHLWRLSVGHTYDELAAYIAEEQRRLEAGEPGLGHPAFATLVAEASVSGAQGTLSKDLSPGTYGLACIRFEGGSRVAIRAAGPFAVGE